MSTYASILAISPILCSFKIKVGHEKIGEWDDFVSVFYLGRSTLCENPGRREGRKEHLQR